MTFGFIKINGRIAMVFLNKTDSEIQKNLEPIRAIMNTADVILEWDNFYSDRTVDELEQFMRTK